ncbi:MAG TPA: methyltransferase domain-containing protein [Candidatus Baltobacteraceae bacterium]|nr:methyltransferase domain-containing protein [Candidatus Baltobacteraceae bacterium]
MNDATLREALVKQLQRNGAIQTEPVAAALRRVPRHRFVPGMSLNQAYADHAVAVKTIGDDVVSSISQPGMIAQMLELLAPLPSDNVLEVGTGTGYNAALLAELVGPTGTVTTLELDEELAGRARATLSELGYTNVTVVAADGSSYPLEPRRYNGITVTARSDDIAKSWWETLRDDGRIVVPLRLESAGEYAVGFERSEIGLRGLGAHPCAFIAIRGAAGASTEGDVFYRDPADRNAKVCLRRISGVIAVRREDATAELLDRADVVIARPVTVFAVTFA